MATILPATEEDPLISIVRITSDLAWADAGPEEQEIQVRRLSMEAEGCMYDRRWLDLVSLILSNAEVVMSKLSDKDFECIFTVTCNLVRRTESLDEAFEIAKLISSKVSQQPTDKPTLRLKVLFNIYNLLESPYAKFFVYMKALNLAAAGKVTESIIPSFKKVESFLQEWGIGKKDQRELFLAISNVLKDNKSTAKDSFSFLTKYLATFSDDGEDAYAMNEAKEEAVRAIIEFVKSPDIFESDLLNMPAIRQLENDEKYALVYQLLKICLTQGLDAYLEFHAANSALVKSYGLVHEDCMTKMRLMSLINLSSDGTDKIPYSVIRETLKITDEEVEYWIVKAITSKKLSCKMDQMNQVVIVSRHVERVFGPAQWRNLRTMLGVWMDNISNAINTIHANKVSDEGVQATEGLAMR